MSNQPGNPNEYLGRLARERELEVEAEERAKFDQTHHTAGSAEETYSRYMRADKYRAMQQLLVEIANTPPADNHAAHFGPRAQDILGGMKRPITPMQRAKERAEELEILACAYRGIADRASQLPDKAILVTIEALKAWEREHPPLALDPLLMP